MSEKIASFTSGYAADLITEGSVSVPNMLLRCYVQLGINEIELVLIIHIINFKQMRKDSYPLPEELAKHMSVDVLTVKGCIASLIEKGLLTVDRKFDSSNGNWVNYFSFDLLFDKLAEIWAFEKAKIAEQNTSNKALSSSNETLGQLYQAFEKEFGRLLSPMETSQLTEWCNGDGYSPELVFEALKRAVLRGVLNFKYIDSILRDWARNNINTVKQAAIYEENFQKTRSSDYSPRHKQEDETKAKQKNDKYKDFYLS